MPTEKRRRQKERRAQRREQAARRARSIRRRSLFRLWVILSGLSLAALGLLELMD